MAHDPKQPRMRKQLLVASVGVATVSFLGLYSGCNGEEKMTNVANLLAIPIDTFRDPSLLGDASTGDASTDASTKPQPLFPSANLLAVPIEAGPKDAALDALVQSGNLLPPPSTDAAADAASDAATDAARDAARDAKIDTGLPTSGNLVPLPPDGSR